MNKRTLLLKAVDGPANLRFEELTSPAEAFGFQLMRTEGSHRVYAHRAVREILKLQPDRNGKAKAHQVRELLARVEEYGLGIEEAS